MSDLTTLMPVTFSVQSAAAFSLVAIWVRYEDSSDEILVFDGVEFHEPFATNSTRALPKADGSVHNFSIVPELGWERTVAKFRAQAEGEGVFTWSGKFPNMALTSTELCAYVGADGTISPDIGCDTHLWQMEAVASQDIGSLTSSLFHLAAGTTAPTVTTDPAYGGGARNILDYATQNDYVVQGSPNGKIPTVPDGTESVLIGGVCCVDSTPGVESFRTIYSRYRAGTTRGYAVFFEVSGGNALKLRCQFIRDPGFTITDITCPVAFVLGVPFVWFFNIDVTAQKVKLLTSVSGSYVEAAMGGAPGTFDASPNQAHLGITTQFPGVGEGFAGNIAQLFSLEYSGLDAGIGDANMQHFLKHNDGFLEP